MITSTLLALKVAWIAACALFDLSTRRVPNGLFLAGGCLALLHMFFDDGAQLFWAQLALSMVHVSFALLFWHWGVWAGADAKFWAVLAFLFRFNMLLAALFLSHSALAAYAAIQSLRQRERNPLPGIPLMSVGVILSPQVLHWLDVQG